VWWAVANPPAWALGLAGELVRDQQKH
jgi:hypothetical protein